MQSSIKLVAGLMALSCAVMGVLAERPRAQEQPCPSHDFPDPIDDFTVFDTALPDADTRVQNESDIDIKFRWFSDLNDAQEDGYYVTYGIRNLATGQSSGLIFLWEDTELSRPSTSPLRSLGSLTSSKCFEARPIRRERLIRYSPSRARNVSVPTYIPLGAISAGKERATWARVVTDFLDDVGHVVDVFFEIRSKFTSDEVTYSIKAEPVNMTIGIGQFSTHLTRDSISLIEESLNKQGFLVEIVDLNKIVDVAVLGELPQRLQQSPLLLMRPLGGSARESLVAEFSIEAAHVSNAMVPVILLSKDDQAIASAGVSILSP